MNTACAFLTGASLGAGLMYVLDPDVGRRRRALARDKVTSLAHQAQDAAEVVARDARNRAQGLAAGDLSVLIGGRRALQNPLRGGWSPTGRAMLAVAGGGLMLYSLTQRSPVACVLGGLGLAMAAEGLSNVGLDNLARLPRQASDLASDFASRTMDAANRVAEPLGFARQGRTHATA